jgi:hypothetical protein
VQAAARGARGRPSSPRELRADICRAIRSKWGVSVERPGQGAMRSDENRRIRARPRGRRADRGSCRAPRTHPAGDIGDGEVRDRLLLAMVELRGRGSLARASSAAPRDRRCDASMASCFPAYTGGPMFSGRSAWPRKGLGDNRTLPNRKWRRALDASSIAG